jgi:hypothetical protein
MAGTLGLRGLCLKIWEGQGGIQLRKLTKTEFGIP